MPAEPPPEKPAQDGASGMGLAALGLELAVALGLGAGLGYWFDTWLGTLPWCLLAGTGLGFAGVLVRMYQAIRRMGR